MIRGVDNICKNKIKHIAKAGTPKYWWTKINQSDFPEIMYNDEIGHSVIALNEYDISHIHPIYIVFCCVLLLLGKYHQFLLAFMSWIYPYSSGLLRRGVGELHHSPSAREVTLKDMSNNDHSLTIHNTKMWPFCIILYNNSKSVGLEIKIDAVIKSYSITYGIFPTAGKTITR